MNPSERAAEKNSTCNGCNISSKVRKWKYINGSGFCCFPCGTTHDNVFSTELWGNLVVVLHNVKSDEFPIFFLNLDEALQCYGSGRERHRFRGHAILEALPDRALPDHTRLKNIVCQGGSPIVLPILDYVMVFLTVATRSHFMTGHEVDTTSGRVMVKVPPHHVRQLQEYAKGNFRGLTHTDAETEEETRARVEETLAIPPPRASPPIADAADADSKPRKARKGNATMAGSVRTVISRFDRLISDFKHMDATCATAKASTNFNRAVTLCLDSLQKRIDDLEAHPVKDISVVKFLKDCRKGKATLTVVQKVCSALKLYKEEHNQARFLAAMDEAVEQINKNELPIHLPRVMATEHAYAEGERDFKLTMYTMVFSKFSLAHLRQVLVLESEEGDCKEVLELQSQLFSRLMLQHSISSQSVDEFSKTLIDFTADLDEGDVGAETMALKPLLAISDAAEEVRPDPFVLDSDDDMGAANEGQQAASSTPEPKVPAKTQDVIFSVKESVHPQVAAELKVLRQLCVLREAPQQLSGLIASAMSAKTGLLSEISDTPMFKQLLQRCQVLVAERKKRAEVVEQLSSYMVWMRDRAASIREFTKHARAEGSLCFDDNVIREFLANTWGEGDDNVLSKGLGIANQVCALKLTDDGLWNATHVHGKWTDLLSAGIELFTTSWRLFVMIPDDVGDKDSRAFLYSDEVMGNILQGVFSCVHSLSHATFDTSDLVHVSAIHLSNCEKWLVQCMDCITSGRKVQIADGGETVRAEFSNFLELHNKFTMQNTSLSDALKSQVGVSLLLTEAAMVLKRLREGATTKVQQHSAIVFENFMRTHRADQVHDLKALFSVFDSTDSKNQTDVTDKQLEMLASMKAKSESDDISEAIELARQVGMSNGQAVPFLLAVQELSNLEIVVSKVIKAMWFLDSSTAVDAWWSDCQAAATNVKRLMQVQERAEKLETDLPPDLSSCLSSFDSMGDEVQRLMNKTQETLRARFGTMFNVCAHLNRQYIRRLSEKLTVSATAVKALIPDYKSYCIRDFNEDLVKTNILDKPADFGKIPAANKVLGVQHLAAKKIYEYMDSPKMMKEVLDHAKATWDEAHNYTGMVSVLNTLVTKKHLAPETLSLHILDTKNKLTAKKMVVDESLLKRMEGMLK